MGFFGGKSAADYQLSVDQGDADLQSIVAILIHSSRAWLWPVSPPTQPNFDAPRPKHIDPLVWGGLYTQTFHARKNLGRIAFRWYLYAAGILLCSGIMPLFEHKIQLIAGITCLFVGYLVYWVGIRGLGSDMQSVVEDVNPLLAKAGYRIKYEVVNPGMFSCSPTEYKLNVFKKNASNPAAMSKGNDVLWSEVIFPTTEAMPPEPVKVYMHAPWYRHFFLWKCGLRRHEFFKDGQPESLSSLHPCVWGALVEAFTRPEMEILRNRRNKWMQGLIGVAVFAFFAARDGFLLGLIAPALCLFASVLVYIYFERRLRATSIEVGHDAWLAACNTWQRPLSVIGFILEYHHKDEPGGFNVRNCLLCGGIIASDFVRFVPNRA